MRKLNVLFIVQGDGRGHMTQALAIQRILLEGGHRICGILLGREPEQEIPDFFASKVTAPIARYQSFAFFNNRANTAIDPLATVIGNLRRLPTVVKSLLAIRREIHARRPDVVVSFLEPLVGICYLLFRPRVPLACVANQYLFLHPDYEFPPGRRLDRLFIKIYAWLTSIGASRRMALSLRERPDRPAGCAVIPPLLRAEVLSLGASPADKDSRPFFLIYLLKAGLLAEIIVWHKRHPEIELHCFTDQKQDSDAVRFDETLTFHRISEQQFLDLMVRCRGMVATAGYQTLCEAMYCGKPILIVPVSNHFEQACNAHEAELLGAGLGATNFDLDRFLEYVPKHQANVEQFRAWVAQAPRRVLQVIESIAKPSE
jgi:uncharacterized protein (TIGR00661 family)